MKILILGGYGVFGGRLAELLSGLAGLDIYICGRTEEKAIAFCKTLTGAARFIPLKLDRKDIGVALKRYVPDMVVDASGPFQKYSHNTYAVVKACIDAKIHYLDFADCADFVFGISEFDGQAKKSGIFALSGVSSFPVLSAAVVSEFQNHMVIESVKGGIAPSPYAGIGLNVMRAVIGYAGGPVKLIRDGKLIEAKGLTESMRYTIAPPGLLPLRNIHFSLVDVPDLQVLPAEMPSLKNIWMGAGPVPEILHRTLNVLAKLRAIFHLPSFEPLSPLFYFVLNLMKFGEHRGGMFIEAQGYVKGKPKTHVTMSWHLLAEGDDGPYIPSMAIEGIVRKYVNGERPKYGARPATNALSLTDYGELFENRNLFMGVRSSHDVRDTIYQSVLGSAYTQLPEQLRALHGSTKKTVWAGKAHVQRGENPLAIGIGKLIGFSKQARNVPLTVTFTPSAKGEHWARNFGGTVFTSKQKIGIGKNTHLITEHFGPVSIGMALVIKDKKLYLQPRRMTVFGFPVPKFLLPKGESFEHEKDGIFHFNVTIKFPIIGLIVAYQGWLKPQG
ncbi:MAG: DUF4166 domain-containing protein [Robiginitomaculum sp.]|nr:DUF4166 domain-containing protein [Robiginitomaculum sp.]